MIKEIDSQKNKAVVLYTIDTEYNIGIRIITDKEFYILCKEA